MLIDLQFVREMKSNPLLVPWHPLDTGWKGWWSIFNPIKALQDGAVAEN
jgi:hypothetical protein